MPHNFITYPSLIYSPHKSLGLAGGPDGEPEGGPAGGPDGGPAGGPAGGPEGGADGAALGGPDGGPDGGAEGGPVGAALGGPVGDFDGGPPGGPDGIALGGPEGGAGAEERAGAGLEGIAGGPVGAGLEGTAGGPVGAEETRLGTTSGSATTDSKSTGLFAAVVAVASFFSQAGVLTSFAGCFSVVERGSETGSTVSDVCHGGVRGESSCSDSIAAASPTLILVAPPSAFSP